MCTTCYQFLTSTTAVLEALRSFVAVYRVLCRFVLNCHHSRKLYSNRWSINTTTERSLHLRRDWHSERYGTRHHTYDGTTRTHFQTAIPRVDGFSHTSLLHTVARNAARRARDIHRVQQSNDGVQGSLHQRGGHTTSLESSRRASPF